MSLAVSARRARAAHSADPMEPVLAFDLPVTGQSVARWMMARDDRITAPPPDGAPLPLSFLVFLRAQPILGLSLHAALGRDPDRGLYGGVSYRAPDLPRVGQALRGSSAVTARKTVDSPRGPMTITTLLTRYAGASLAPVEESVRMIDLPPGPAPIASPPPRDPSPGFAPLAVLAPITRRQVSWMTVETGDVNHLHFDTAYASGRGYRDIVVPAPLISALVERELTRHGGPVVELDLRFQAPTHPGDELALFGRHDGDQMQIEVFAGGTLRLEGRARHGGVVTA